LTRRNAVEADEKKKPEDRALKGAPKGPKAFTSFCVLCKIYGHSDLTCFRQGNTPTPGPSTYQKPSKQISQRTPKQGLGYSTGIGAGPSGIGKGDRKARGGIPFK